MLPTMLFFSKFIATFLIEVLNALGVFLTSTAHLFLGVNLVCACYASYASRRASFARARLLSLLKMVWPFFIVILCLSQATTNASSTSEAKPWEANDLRRSTARLSSNGPRFGVPFGTTDETTYALGSRRV